MSTAVQVPAAGAIPSSRTDQDADRVARGAPRGHIDDIPVYGWGQAPPYLRTQTQLAEQRLKLSEGQPALAYIRTRKFGDIPLYDPAAAQKMRPLASATKRTMETRRTCPECGKVRQQIVRGGRCSVCRDEAWKEQQRKNARTCWECRTVRERPYPPTHHRCADCRRKQLAEERERDAQWLRRATHCHGDGCAVKLRTKKKVIAWRKAQSRRVWYMPSEWATRCPPCQEAYEAELAASQRRYEERQREIREEEERADRRRREWAAEALGARDAVILDTETTGLDADSRIVEIAVIRPGGEVLLNTLVNPGVPIPRESSEIHGITDEDVKSAPTFSSILDQLTSILQGQRVLIYNDVYDVGRLAHEVTLHHTARAEEEAASVAASSGEAPEAVRDRLVTEARARAVAWVNALRAEDVMIPYSRWVADWSDYHGDYRWQPLNGGHRALGDCRAVVDCLRAIAGRRESAQAYETAGASDGQDEGQAGGWSNCA